MGLGRIKCRKCNQHKKASEFPSKGWRCKSCCNEQLRAWRYRNPDKALKISKRWRSKSRPALAANSREFYLRRKVAVLAAYGGRCKCCGESRHPFLTIDHVFGDGAKHRKVAGGAGDRTYSWLVKHSFPPGFQVLCWNCNCGRKINGGICPHVETVNAASI